MQQVQKEASKSKHGSKQKRSKKRKQKGEEKKEDGEKKEKKRADTNINKFKRGENDQPVCF